MNQEELQSIPTSQLFEELEARVSNLRAEISPLPDDIRLIIECVCECFRTSEGQLMSRTQSQPVAWARFVALTCINAADYSLQQTAAVFRMDHSNVAYARKRVRSLRLTDSLFKRRFMDTLTMIDRKAPGLITTPPSAISG